MANTLEIKKISTASVSAADICRVLDEANIGFVAVDNHCWAEAFPYRPTMEVRMAHNGKQLLINYRVTEECVRFYCHLTLFVRNELIYRCFKSVR